MVPNPASVLEAPPPGCTCGYPKFQGYGVQFHTHECQLRTGVTIGHVLDRITREIEKARSKFNPFNSPHEGYAVIAEELEELWHHAKANEGRSDEAMVEAIQVAAMSIRYVLDLSEGSVKW